MAAAGLGVGGAAGAHELECGTSVQNGPVASIATYPTTITFGFRVTNRLMHHASVIEHVEDTALAPYGWRWPATEDLTLSGGETVSFKFDLTLDSYEACRTLASKSGTLDATLRGTDSVTFDNYFRVTWEDGEAQCSARLICYPQPRPPPQDPPPQYPPPQDPPPQYPPPQYPPPQYPPPGEATRSMGFYKTHPGAVRRCLQAHGGSLRVGSLTIESQEHALGLLWGSPARDARGVKRTWLEQHQFLLARQTLVGMCNYRLFNTPPAPPDLLTTAGTACSGDACEPLSELIHAVTRYNTSGVDESLPSGMDLGDADPQTARDLAHDPTYAAGHECRDR